MGDTTGDISTPSLECRICQLPAELSELVAPCHCSGSMKYVHVTCLQAWRVRSPGNSLRCGVCRAAYAHVRVPAWGVAHLRYASERIACTFQHATWARDGPVWSALNSVAEGRHPACCALRLGAWAFVLCGSVVRSRLLLLFIAATHEFIMGLDRTLDPILFPKALLDFMHWAFPSLCGFGYLGISDAFAWGKTTDDFDELFTMGSLCELSFVKKFCTISEAAGQREFDLEKLIVAFEKNLDSFFTLPRTMDDVVLGAFLMSLDAHLFHLFCHRRQSYLYRLLQRIPSLWADLSELHRHFVPELDHVAAVFVFFLPACAYGARWILALFLILPMDVVPFHSHLTFHLLLAIVAAGALLATLTMVDLVQEDFMRWYADFTAMPVAPRIPIAQDLEPGQGQYPAAPAPRVVQAPRSAPSTEIQVPSEQSLPMPSSWNRIAGGSALAILSPIGSSSASIPSTPPMPTKLFRKSASSSLESGVDTCML